MDYTLLFYHVSRVEVTCWSTAETLLRASIWSLAPESKQTKTGQGALTVTPEEKGESASENQQPGKHCLLNVLS